MTARPFVDTARIKIQGLSSEQFERREIGDQMTLTVKGTIVSDLEAAQAHEGTRRVQTLKLERVVEGVSEKVHETAADGQMSLDDAAEDEPETDAPGGAFTGGPAFSVPADEDEGDEDTNVVDFVGPTFSGADNG